MSFIYNMSDLWNAGATTFTAIKMNVTDTASASGSLLMDLQVGGSSRFSVRKDGAFGTSSDLFLSVGGRWDFLPSATVAASMTASNFNLAGATLSFTAASGGANSGDLILGRNAAASLRLGAADAAAPVAQTLGVQSVVAGTSNTAGTNFTIKGSAGTGTGAGGSIIFQVAPAGSSGTAQNAFATALTIGSSGSATTVTATALYASTFAISGGQGITVTSSQLGLFNTGLLGWTNNAGSSGALDVILTRDAANTLALKNGANAQELRVYKNTTGTVYKAMLGDNNLIKISGEAFTNGAGASTGTLTNAPAVGNPTKWIPIDDNGTTRYIPAW